VRECNTHTFGHTGFSPGARLPLEMLLAIKFQRFLVDIVFDNIVAELGCRSVLPPSRVGTDHYPKAWDSTTTLRSIATKLLYSSWNPHCSSWNSYQPPPFFMASTTILPGVPVNYHRFLWNSRRCSWNSHCPSWNPHRSSWNSYELPPFCVELPLFFVEFLLTTTVVRGTYWRN
jgi:hypothetical protein